MGSRGLFIVKLTKPAPFVQGIVSGLRSFSKYYTWPSHFCMQENQPDSFSNVGAYAKDIWEIIRKDGDPACQTETKSDIT